MSREEDFLFTSGSFFFYMSRWTGIIFHTLISQAWSTRTFHSKNLFHKKWFLGIVETLGSGWE